MFRNMLDSETAKSNMT